MGSVSFTASICAAIFLVSCQSADNWPGSNATEAERLQLVTSDLTGLGGKDWTGTLMQRAAARDAETSTPISAHVTVKLDCLTITPIATKQLALLDPVEICISVDGDEFGDAKIIALQRLGPGFVALQTQSNREENGRPAMVRHSYILSTTAITAGREVSFDGGETWTEFDELDVERGED